MTDERRREIASLATDPETWCYCMNRAKDENPKLPVLERVEIAFTYYTEAKQAEYKAKEDGKLVCTWLGEQLAQDSGFLALAPDDEDGRYSIYCHFLRTRFPRLDDGGWSCLVSSWSMGYADTEEKRLQAEMDAEVDA